MKTAALLLSLIVLTAVWSHQDRSRSALSVVLSVRAFLAIVLRNLSFRLLLFKIILLSINDELVRLNALVDILIRPGSHWVGCLLTHLRHKSTDLRSFRQLHDDDV